MIDDLRYFYAFPFNILITVGCELIKGTPILKVNSKNKVWDQLVGELTLYWRNLCWGQCVCVSDFQIALIQGRR